MLEVCLLIIIKIRYITFCIYLQFRKLWIIRIYNNIFCMILLQIYNLDFMLCSSCFLSFKSISILIIDSYHERFHFELNCSILMSAEWDNFSFKYEHILKNWKENFLCFFVLFFWLFWELYSDSEANSK